METKEKEWIKEWNKLKKERERKWKTGDKTNRREREERMKEIRKK